MSMIQDKEFSQPYEKFYLDVGDGHQLYVELLGNPKGVPFIFLHGGPGSGCQNNHRTLFNFKDNMIILFDQRGAGRSLPKRSLINNTTQALISDMEIIRKKLNIKKWAVVGGSWGSTLGLAYAEQYSDYVNGLILRSVFLGSKDNISWAFENAAKIFRPHLFSQWSMLLNKEEQNDPMHSYGKRLESKDNMIAASAALVWGTYETILSQINSNNLSLPSSFNDDFFKNNKHEPNTPYFEWHYIKNNFFLKDNELIDNAYKLNKIPGSIIQGRYDLLCPPINAYQIAKKWQSGELIIVDEGAHTANSDPMRSVLVNAIKDLAIKLF